MTRLVSSDQGQHQREILRNRDAWQAKPLLRALYAGFYGRILQLLDRTLPGQVVELGSGIGNLKAHWPEAVCTDLFPNPWLDLACDAYELPFREGTVSHLVLFDVFHHLATPGALLKEARRVLVPDGRLILFEPFISLMSWPVYGAFHHEPVGWKKPIAIGSSPPAERGYYAAQGNATRIFFRGVCPDLLHGWHPFHAQAFSCFDYLLSGGYSKPALYPRCCAGGIGRVDRWLSRWPRLFAGRCLVGLRRAAEPQDSPPR